ncbi:BREX-1 system adenine-specific DNA-methyltransferase PglX [Bacillus atrophaeus]|uniref:BREX-1 system adenine-specific DNA-methyltransferase PglX n=1 Tax=Bacillus atrophaeus TaxID=1452 RepID=UPI002DFE4508|nr:BREX-1 system adenine-specific DNA-methyltransferase PglX [Bacillus atrophaeus]MED4579922.1 BREX-1 system adenine-specific DNA-methyltransferase PglX [Bacillus atrophaeus]MED4848531.1 BREX-1 system adenine-specific DNA-methyltransferase PglX [Bacillus atrophaeus]
MNKSALKTFATNARRELLKKVEARAMKIGITENNIKKAEIESSDAIFIDGRWLLKEEKIQRDRLIDRINQIGFNRVMEEVAYTWFNRFTALRFMEVNDYLPTKVRVLSSTNADSTEPDMMKEALSLDLDLDKEYIYKLKMNNNSEELFKYLIIKHCNDLNRFLPFMFETIDDYKEILFPEGLLSKDSFIRQMIDTEKIPEDSWRKVEIIGWLYQYYIVEEKDRVIQAKKKYKTEEIPFATQLFTPDWIVRYMVQNSLGRYWIESHKEHQDLLGNWEFYLDNRNPEPDFEEKLALYINKELNVEDIKCFDPAMGSGHILVYLFDVLYEIYSKCGYMEREIPRLILENNLYGLDIDDRAYQLACFSVVMKAVEYNSRFFRSIEREGLSMNLASIQESNSIDDEYTAYIAGEKNGKAFEMVHDFIQYFKNAKTFGSLIKVGTCDFEFLKQRLKSLQDKPARDLFEEEVRIRAIELLPRLIKQAEIMTESYDVLITNPPYMGSRYMTPDLSQFLKNNYTAYTDLFSVFIEYSFEKVKPIGHIGLITPFVWMFLSAYEDIRKRIVAEKNISSLVQLEYNAFEVAVVPVCTFTLRNYQLDINGEYIRLSDFTGVENQPIKTLEAVKDEGVHYRFSQKNDFYKMIPGQPIAYWISQELGETFVKENKLLEYIDVTGSQNITADNNKFLRKLWEVNSQDVNSKWSFYIKGGNYRKWYGNIDYVVDWSEEARNFYKNNKTSNLLNEKYWFRNGLTYNGISNRGFSVRIARDGIYDKKGPTFHVLEDKISENYIIALLNTKVINYIMDLYNPTMSYQMKDVNNLPVILTKSEDLTNRVEELAEMNISISKMDWDSNETSWNFKKHPFLYSNCVEDSIEGAYSNWERYTNDQFHLLKENETELNKIFIELYGLSHELSPEVDEEDVTIKKTDRVGAIKTFISYIVGCMLGRYSLDEEGLIYAGGEFDINKYSTFKANRDNILPILPGSYFKDDIVSRLVDFVRIKFGAEELNKNLDFIADTLGRKKGETAKDTLRRYFINDFFKDHVQIYNKRPIYWLFTSDKEKAFNCLIYMHRYDKSTLSRIRTDYLHEYQIRLDAEKKDLLNIIEGDSTAKEISNAKKELKSLDKKIEELKAYDALLHHMADMQIEIDLDDGVKVNYEKFKGLVAKI